MPSESKKVFITGAGGYIGSTLAFAFLKEGWHVTGYGYDTHFEDISRACNSSELELIVGDILDGQKMSDAMRGVNAIVHTAGPAGEKACSRDPEGAIKSIIRGTRMVADSAKKAGVSRLIHISTQAVYSTFKERPMPLQEDAELSPDDWYGALKAEAEYELSDMPAIIVRLTNVYGRGLGVIKKTDAVGKFIDSALNGKPITVFGDGSQGVDFVHIDDVVDVIKGFARMSEPTHDVFNVGSGRVTTLKELAEVVQKVAKDTRNIEVPISFEPAPEGKIWPNRWVTNEKIKKLFPEFPMRDLMSGITELVDSF